VLNNRRRKIEKEYGKSFPSTAEESSVEELSTEEDGEKNQG
jgi:hypothetical protein